VPKLPQKYAEVNGQLSKLEKYCGTKEIRFQNMSISGEQSRHVEENSSTLGALR